MLWLSSSFKVGIPYTAARDRAEEVLLTAAARFITPTHGIREIKDHMLRDILRGFDEHRISIASPTVQVVGLPAVRIGEPGFHQDKDSQYSL